MSEVRTERVVSSEDAFDHAPLNRVFAAFAEESSADIAFYDLEGKRLCVSGPEPTPDGLPCCLTDDAGLWDAAKTVLAGLDDVAVYTKDGLSVTMASVRANDTYLGVVAAGSTTTAAGPEQPSGIQSLIRVCASLAGELVDEEYALEGMTEELCTRYEELSLFYELNKALDVSAKREDILELIAASVAETLETDSIFISLPGMSIEKSYPDSPSGRAPWKVITKILIETRTEDGSGIALNYIDQNESLKFEEAGYAHALVVPLHAGDFGGYFATFRRNEARPFATGDVKLLESVAAQLSLTLNNMRILEEQKKLFDASIFSLARLADSRDQETGEHLERMSKYARALAACISRMDGHRDLVTTDYADAIYRSSPLHDIGKVGIPDSILLKSGPLNDEEWQIMKTHTTIGGDTLRDAESRLESKGNTFLTLGKMIAYCHHEKWDGSGYPKGLSGEQIPLSARIVALADAYDAMTSKRRYKDAVSHKEARTEILDCRGTHFDPCVVEAFLTVEHEFKEIRRGFENSGN